MFSVVFKSHTKAVKRVDNTLEKTNKQNKNNITSKSTSVKATPQSDQ